MLEATRGQQGTAWQEGTVLMVCSSPLMTEIMTDPVVTVLCHFEEGGGTMTVMTQTSMASTSVELTTAKASRGTPSTQLRVATRASGQK